MTYELAKKLKEAGWKFIEMIDRSSHCYYCGNPFIEIDGRFYIVPVLSELIKAVKSMRNEIAIGWNDSGCFWHFQYGERGCGNMMEGFGETYDALDADTLEEAVAELWLKLNKKQLN